ncbi:hypothetical protein ACWFRC_25820 [Bacillus cereus]|uniref:hypothetical protein n=1 Tax=Bacillus mycoides TaxID=1405 RepID=UPI001A2D4D8E|nr:hypothetical protein [Bacillus mycoides]MBJ7997725.1 hypothetical protein [Bacillus cereus]
MNEELQIAKELTLAVVNGLTVPDGQKTNSLPEQKEEYNKSLALEVTKLYTEIYKGVIKARDMSDEEINV